jgi:hypothetical protein
MRIAIVGGIERNESEYLAEAARLGVKLTFHSGHMAGRGSASLVDMVTRADLVIVLTDVNSHGAVISARRTARRRGVPVELFRRFSAARLSEVLDARRRSATTPRLTG